MPLTPLHSSAAHSKLLFRFQQLNSERRCKRGPVDEEAVQRTVNQSDTGGGLWGGGKLQAQVYEMPESDSRSVGWGQKMEGAGRGELGGGGGGGQK